MTTDRPGATSVVVEHGRKAEVCLEELCDQQFWLLGFDIRRPEGNLLTAAGFKRKRVPNSRCTQYVKEGPGQSVGLWGFGLLWVSHRTNRSLYLNRDGEYLAADVSAVPRIRNPWSVNTRLGLAGKGDPQLAGIVARWFSGYERWVKEVAGIEYRRIALSEWGSCCGAQEIASRWMSASVELDSLANRQYSPEDSQTRFPSALRRS